MTTHARRTLTAWEQRRSTEALHTGFVRSGLALTDLWAACLGLDEATPSPAQLSRLLGGGRDGAEPDALRTAHEHDVLAQALNDHFTDHDQNHPVRYSADLDSPTP